jgi:hypothetical protein
MWLARQCFIFFRFLLSAFCFHPVLLLCSSYAVFLQNTPILSDAVPRVGTLGWYALPRWGKWDDVVSGTGSMPSTGIGFIGVASSVGADRPPRLRS